MKPSPARQFFRLILTAAFLVAGGGETNLAGGESNVCEVHHLEMHQERVRIMYGLPSQETFAFLDAAAKAFPHHGRMGGLGGCIPPAPGEATDAPVWICPACRKAAAAWKSSTVPSPSR